MRRSAPYTPENPVPQCGKGKCFMTHEENRVCFATQISRNKVMINVSGFHAFTAYSTCTGMGLGLAQRPAAMGLNVLHTELI